MIIPQSFSVPKVEHLEGRKELRAALKDFFQECRDMEDREQEHYDPPLAWLLPYIKQEAVKEMLVHTHGNQLDAARRLGINRGTLRKVNTSKVRLPEIKV